MARHLGSTVLNGTFLRAGLNASEGRSAAQQVDLGDVCVTFTVMKTENSTWGDDSGASAYGVEVEAFARKLKIALVLFLFLIGGPANVINMAVFYKQGLKDRVNLLLFSLSLADEVYLVSSFSLNYENVYLLFATGEPKSHWNALMVNKNLICFLGTGFISRVLSAIIACERCYCVIRPLKYHTLMRTRTMAAIVVSVFVVLFSLHFIVAYKYRVGCVYDPVTGAVTTALTAGQFYTAHKELVDQLDGVVFGAVLSGYMMIVVIAATVITTVKLRQLTTWRSEASSSLSSRDVALTKMLIGNSVFFIVFSTPSCLFRVVWFMLPEIGAGGRHFNFFLSTLWTVEGFCYVNATFNFFIYYVMGSRYRETFWALFGRDIKQGRSQKLGHRQQDHKARAEGEVTVRKN